MTITQDATPLRDDQHYSIDIDGEQVPVAGQWLVESLRQDFHNNQYHFGEDKAKRKWNEHHETEAEFSAAHQAQRDQEAAERTYLATLPVPPCPSWCELPAGHQWDDCNFDDSHKPTRSHHAGNEGAQLSWYEGAGQWETPLIDVYCKEGLITSDGARDLAADLLRLADIADGAVS